MIGKSIYTDEQLNYYKFLTLVVDEFPEALRQTFKHMWDLKFGPGSIWDASEVVQNLFLAMPEFPQISRIRSGIAPRCFKLLSTGENRFFPRQQR